MLNKMSIVVFFLLTTVAFSAVTIKEFKPIETSIFDYAEVLGLRCYGGTFKTTGDFKEAWLRIAFFKDGELKPFKTISRVAGSGMNGRNSGEVSVKIQDLDYLSIKGAPKNSYRIFYTLATLSGRSSAFDDISKTEFDLSGSQSSMWLEKGTADIKNPLFYVMGTHENSTTSGLELDYVFKRNKNAYFMVVYLDFTK